jgi:SAM-dependent methyltransferase
MEYYKNYYKDKGDVAYLGANQAQTSRMQVFCDWLRAELKPGAKVLDVGCGDAVFAELMPEFEWYGVDINTEKAAPRFRGKEDFENHLQEHDLMKPPYPWDDGYFDAVITSEVLEHLWDLRVVHREVKRLLKRDGLYVLSTPNFDWITNHLESFRRVMQTAEAHWTFEHIRHYNYATHKRFLNECGFVIEKHTGADGHYCPVMFGICKEIANGLREKGVDVNEYELHKLAGRATVSQGNGDEINYQHTIILSARKA